MLRAPSTCTRNALLALLAVGVLRAPAIRAQDRPKVDWDTAAANTLIVLLTDGHVELPNLDAEQQPQKKLTIAVLGDDRFGKAIVALAKGKQTKAPNEAELQAVHVAEQDLLAKKDQWVDSDVIVLATDSQLAQTQVLAIMAGKKALLVGRRRGFVAAGGHLHLWLSKGKPRFQIDLVAVRKLGIKVSSAAWKLSKPQPEKEEK